MQALDSTNKFDYTDKVLEIIGGQGVASESVKKRLRELFIEVNKDVQIETENKLDNYQQLMDEAAREEEEADARAEAKAKAENAEKKERQMEREQRKLDHGMILAAVEILRTIHQTTMPLRHNKWRKPNAGFTNQNIRILGKIGEGSFGAVYLIENGETKSQYAMKTQLVRVEDGLAKTPPAWRGAATPPITPSSEASKRSEKAMKERHLMTKRFNETKCYLQYIRSSHPSICNLEAFFDLRLPDQDELDNGHCHIFEYCDWGTLEHIVVQYNTPRWGTGEPENSIWGHKPKNMPAIYKHAAIPEAFIWHVYMQTMEGLSFLHGDHELNKKQEFHQRNQVICLDIKLDNIFLHDSGKPNTYPTVKIGDFGEATYVPYGDSRWHDTGNALCRAAEEPYLSAKYDVWCVGAVLHVMSHSGRRPLRPGGFTKENIKDEPKWGICDPHLSKVLAKELEKPREMDENKRMTAAQILKHIKPIAEEMIRLTYRRLQPWARPELQIEFDEGYLEQIEGGSVLSEIEESEDDDDDDDDDDDVIVNEPSGGEGGPVGGTGAEVGVQPSNPTGTPGSGEKKTKEQLAKEKLAKDQLAKDQLAKDQLAKDQLAKDQLAKDQLAKDQLAKEKLAREKQAKEQQAKEQQKEQLRIQREEELKRQREEGQIDESTSLAPPQKRRFIRYRKLRAYRE
ncbi:hypothetical protein ACHAPC_007502 [Botrytis cinerea]